MAQTGSFGDIVFEVSSEKIKTWDGFSRQMSAGFAQHDVVVGKPKLEATGYDLARVGFTVRLDAQHCNPSVEIAALESALAGQAPEVLVIGTKPLGEYVLTEINEARRFTDAAGRTLVAVVELKFTEWN